MKKCMTKIENNEKEEYNELFISSVEFTHVHTFDKFTKVHQSR